MRQQVVARGCGAALTKSKVVFAGTALIAMTFDGYRHRRVALQETSLTHQRGLGFVCQGRAVITEIDGVADFGQSVFSAGLGVCSIGA